MRKTILLTAMLFSTVSSMAGADTPFDYFHNTTESPNDPIILIAEKMYVEFSTDETEIISEKETDTTIRNPFLSQLPVYQTEIAPPINAPVPSSPAPPVLKEAEESLPNIQMAGLIWNTDKPQAILNNKVVGIGDDINGWKIIEISKEGVLLESLSQTRHRVQP